MHSKLLYHDPFIIQKVKAANTAFYMPFEPDGNHVVGMWDLDHNGRWCVDGSGYGYHGRWLNNPPIVEGIDCGFGSTLYPRLDGRHFYVYADDQTLLKLSLHAYFGITCRIYPEDISASDGLGGNKFRTIIHKADIASRDINHDGSIATAGHVSNGYHLAVTPDGRVRFTMMRGGWPFTWETLPGVITASDPPFPYDIAVVVNQINRIPAIPELETQDPGNIPGADPEAEAPHPRPNVASNVQIIVNNRYFAIQTLEHLWFVNDRFQRLRFGAAWAFGGDKMQWFKWKGGIQQVRFYDQYLLTTHEIQNLYENKLTIREMPFGSPALAGHILVFEDLALILGAYDPVHYDSGGYELSTNEFGILGFPGFDKIGFDEGGFDTLHLTHQGEIQNGGYDPRGFSIQGYHCIPVSQS